MIPRICIARLDLLILVAIVLASCGREPGSPPQIGAIKIVPNTISVGATVVLSANTQGATKYEWTASRGTITNPNAVSTEYNAPDTPGPVTITLTVQGSDGTSTTKNESYDVVDTSPTPTPTTPSPPTPTATSEPPPLPSATATPPNIAPLVEIFPQAMDGEVRRYIDSDDSLGSISTEYTEDEDCRNSGPYGLRITFDFRNGGYGGWLVHWESSPNRRFDASQFAEITFFVKGTAPQSFQVGIKDISETEVKVEAGPLVVLSQSQFRQVVIPLSKFVTVDPQGDPENTPNVDIANVRNVNFGFNQSHGSGEICIDDIAFR